jgi:hypothetical protein
MSTSEAMHEGGTLEYLWTSYGNADGDASYCREVGILRQKDASAKRRDFVCRC